MSDASWAGSAFASVKGHPREALGVAALLTGAGLFGIGVDPYYAIGFPGGIFCLNGLVMWINNNHVRKMAEIEVRQIESLEGAAIRDRARKSLARRKKNGNHNH